MIVPSFLFALCCLLVGLAICYMVIENDIPSGLFILAAGILCFAGAVYFAPTSSKKDHPKQDSRVERALEALNGH